MRAVRIDHIIYATTDLDAAAARVESVLGLSAVQGGRHEDHGTHNRIVSLGGGYLELMAIADPQEAASGCRRRRSPGRDSQRGWWA